MRYPLFSKILLFAVGGLLWACAGANAPGGAAGPSGGPVGGIGNAPINGSAAAQPMDTGAAGATKDLDGLKYFLRDATATVLCQEGAGQVKVRFQGFLMSEDTKGETFTMTGLLKIMDLSAGRYQVTQVSMDQGQMGFFKTTLKVQSDLNVSFFHVLSHDGNLETLKPVIPGQFVVAFPAEPRPELKVEQSLGAGRACLEKAKDYEMSEDADG